MDPRKTHAGGGNDDTRDSINDAHSAADQEQLVGYHQQVATPEQQYAGDNKLAAVLFMNFAVICETGMQASYRVAAREGFHAVELNLIRNFLAFFVASAWCWFTSTAPFEKFPHEHKTALLIRMAGGQTVFLTTNIAAAYAPLSIAIVCRQTTTFWASLTAYLVLGEKMLPLEIVGMVLCFAAVIVLAMQQRNEEMTEEYAEANPYDRQNIGVYLSLSGAVILAAQTVAYRALKTVRPEVSIFYNSLWLRCECSVPLRRDDSHWEGNSSGQLHWSPVRLRSRLSYFRPRSHGWQHDRLRKGQTRLRRSSQLHEPRLQYCFLCDTFILHEQLNVIELCCALWILAVALGIAIFKLRRSRQA